MTRRGASGPVCSKTLLGEQPTTMGNQKVATDAGFSPFTGRQRVRAATAESGSRVTGDKLRVLQVLGCLPKTCRANEPNDNVGGKKWMEMHAWFFYRLQRSVYSQDR